MLSSNKAKYAISRPPHFRSAFVTGAFHHSIANRPVIANSSPRTALATHVKWRPINGQYRANKIGNANDSMQESMAAEFLDLSCI
jgi:hypothetical protein